MNTRRFETTPEHDPALLERTSIGGAMSDPALHQWQAKSSRSNLSALFVMPDLGKSGVVGGRASEALPTEHQPRGAGSSAQVAARAGIRNGDTDPSTISLSDGTKITFANADRLTDSARQ